MRYEFDIVGRFARSEPHSDASPQTAEAARQMLARRPFLVRRVARYEEAAHYRPSPELQAAMNVAIATGRPLLLTGEPGTGKTMAAYFVARRLGLGDPLRFQVKSDSRARDLLYEFDAVARFRDAQSHGGTMGPGEGPADGQGRAQGGAPRPGLMRYVVKRELWLAFEGRNDGPVVLLIDEIDKAPRDFPNDLLRELEDMRFVIGELDPPDNVVQCEPRLSPIIIITSNLERRLPEPFLRRCVYHNIDMGEEQIRSIVKDRVRALDDTALREPFISDALTCFLALRRNALMDKRPCVDEFWFWLEVFEGETPDAVARRDDVSRAAADLVSNGRTDLSKLPAVGCLIKTADDLGRLE